MSTVSYTQVQPGNSLWRYVWKLLRLRWVIFASGFRRGKLWHKIGTIILGLLAVSGMAFAFVLSWLLLRFLRSPELAQYFGDTRSLLASIPVAVVTATSVA